MLTNNTSPGTKMPLYLLIERRMILSQKEVDIKIWDSESEMYLALKNEKGEIQKTKQTKIKMQKNSKYKGYILVYEGEVNLLESEIKIEIIKDKVYTLTKTPYQINIEGEIIIDNNGNRLLDYNNQVICKINGEELINHFQSINQQLNR